MANSVLICKQCRDYFPRGDMLKTPFGNFCSVEHKLLGANKKLVVIKKDKRKVQRKKDKLRLEELKPRPKWYAKLQVLVNQWIVHVRDSDKPCYTCGTENPNIKYDAGHRHHAGRGGGDRRRFVKENIKKQCSVNCNQHGGGMPVEYDAALNKEYGPGFSDKLACVVNYPELKEQFPTWQDIENEIKRYRELLRAEGLKPSV
ncbi:MAG TPA: hypothetical protein EYN54_10790 [Methylococcaceae bacterium]|nr:hypothetical protein [Methylococcaceae bacterium]